MTGSAPRAPDSWSTPTCTTAWTDFDRRPSLLSMPTMATNGPPNRPFLHRIHGPRRRRWRPQPRRQGLLPRVASASCSGLACSMGRTPRALTSWPARGWAARLCWGGLAVGCRPCTSTTLRLLWWPHLAARQEFTTWASRQWSEWATAVGAAVGRGPAKFYRSIIQRIAGPRAEPLGRSLRVSSGAFSAATGWVSALRCVQGGWEGAHR